MIKTYNQNETNTFTNDCSIFTIHQIFKTMYGIDFKYSFIDGIVEYFVKIGILLKGGAVFETIYNSFAKKASEKLDLNILVKKISILTTKFEDLTNDGYAWGLWLRNGNKEYLQAIKKGYLTNKDIDNIAEQGGGFQHNNCFSMNTLQEVATGTEIVLDITTLRYGIKKGVFGSLARSFIGGDNFTKDVGVLLQLWKNNPHFNPAEFKKLSDYETKVMNKAADILLFYEIKDDDNSKRIYK